MTEQPQKLKLALYWAASCGGCEIAVLDTNERILDVAALADIVLWPVAVDGKYTDIEAMEDGAIDITLFNGSIRNSEAEHIAKLLRQKSKILIAFGTCACQGGVVGLANLASKEEIFNRVYETAPSNIKSSDGKIFPKTRLKVDEGELTLPEFYERVLPLNQVVKVDYYVPGCPPNPPLVEIAIDAIASSNLPPLGATIGINSTVCKECLRERDETKKISEFKRIYEVPDVDPDRCLLEQNILCCGPATMAGCGASCPTANNACRGCYGPAPGVRDQGAKMISVLGSIIDAETPEETQQIIEQIRDYVGIFHQFSLPGSILKQGRNQE
ncbi:MAG: NADH-quinone oxidoreductase subunit B family protein [Candidatus Hodarchaeales archaeon]|jgi:F420-non-reducing hydrogenase small subunit